MVLVRTNLAGYVVTTIPTSSLEIIDFALTRFMFIEAKGDEFARTRYKELPNANTILSKYTE